MDTAALFERIAQAKTRSDDGSLGYWEGYQRALQDVLEAERREWKGISPQFDPLTERDT